MLDAKIADCIPDWTDAEEGSVLKIVDGTPTWVHTVSMISFEVDGYSTYYAIEGMTWQQWCDSVFNPDYWSYSPSINDGVSEADTYILYGGERVAYTDVIEADATYWTEFDSKQEI